MACEHRPPTPPSAATAATTAAAASHRHRRSSGSTAATCHRPAARPTRAGRQQPAASRRGVAPPIDCRRPSPFRPTPSGAPPAPRHRPPAPRRRLSIAHRRPPPPRLAINAPAGRRPRGPLTLRARGRHRPPPATRRARPARRTRRRTAPGGCRSPGAAAWPGRRWGRSGDRPVGRSCAPSARPKKSPHRADPLELPPGHNLRLTEHGLALSA